MVHVLMLPRVFSLEIWNTKSKQVVLQLRPKKWLATDSAELYPLPAWEKRSISSSESPHHWHTRRFYPHLVQLILRPLCGHTLILQQACRRKPHHPVCLGKKYPKDMANKHLESDTTTATIWRSAVPTSQADTGHWSADPGPGSPQQQEKQQSLVPLCACGNEQTRKTRHCGLSISKRDEQHEAEQEVRVGPYCHHEGGKPLIMFFRKIKSSASFWFETRSDVKMWRLRLNSFDSPRREGWRLSVEGNLSLEFTPWSHEEGEIVNNLASWNLDKVQTLKFKVLINTNFGCGCNLLQDLNQS